MGTQEDSATTSTAVAAAAAAAPAPAIASDDMAATVQDSEGQVKKLKYPRSVAFIISNEFCERFNFYGMRTILVLYLVQKLNYDDDSATVIYHVFISMVYFLTLFGAILADSWLGKYRTILYLSIVYAIGNATITMGAIPTLNLPATFMTILGLFLIALGSGGIKPCVAAFGGDQFKIPEQAKMIATFFSLFYFSINSGSLISTSVTPILRQDITCFGEKDCFSLAFGVPGVLMMISIVIFMLGKYMYVMKKPAGNMFVKVFKCVKNALSTKAKEQKINKRDHWLDYAVPEYGQKLVDEVKILLRILLLYIPLPVFWALFDQQGSRWTFQATRMTGVIGNFEVKPDQMQVLNPLLILVFIPLYDVVFYPLLSKIGIRRPLQKLTLGGILAGISFVISALVEINLEDTYAIVPGSGEAQLRIFNGMPCDYTITVNGSFPSVNDQSSFVLKSLAAFQEKHLSTDNATQYGYQLQSNDAQACPNRNGVFTIKSGKAMSYFIHGDGVTEYTDEPEKSKRGFPLFRILANTKQPYDIYLRDEDDVERYGNKTTQMELNEVVTGRYDILVGDKLIGNIKLNPGGVYTILIQEFGNNEFKWKEFAISEPNTVHMMWLIPQYVVMTLGEVMYSVTGLEFSYSQAPDSMKAVLQACWQLTIAVGNVIVVIVAETKIFKSQSNEFFLFAALMFIDMAVFVLLAKNYKPSALYAGEEQPMIATSSKAKKGIDNPAMVQKKD